MMASSNRLWNPSKILQLGKYSPEESCTCVGYAPSKGRRCRNQIAAVNHEEARKMLERISRMDMVAADLEEDFEEIASLLSCRRWHQNQAAAMASKWYDAVEKYRAEVMRRRAREQIYTSRISVTTATPTTSNRTRSTRPQLSTFSPAVTHPIPSPSSQLLPRRVSHATNRSLPAADTLVRPATPPTSTAPTFTTTTSSGDDHKQSSPNTPTDADCAICFEDINSDDSRILQCKHKFHRHCIGTWFATQDASALSLTCPYCRRALVSR